MKPTHVVDWGFACGRGYLAVNGIVVAMEADVCRDERFGQYWKLEDFKTIVAEGLKI